MLGVDEIREATKEDKGPIMVVQIKYSPDGYADAYIAKDKVDGSVKDFNTLEAAQKAVGMINTNTSNSNNGKLCKPKFLIVTY